MVPATVLSILNDCRIGMQMDLPVLAGQFARTSSWRQEVDHSL